MLSHNLLWNFYKAGLTPSPCVTPSEVVWCLRTLSLAVMIQKDLTSFEPLAKAKNNGI